MAQAKSKSRGKASSSGKRSAPAKRSSANGSSSKGALACDAEEPLFRSRRLVLFAQAVADQPRLREQRPQRKGPRRGAEGHAQRRRQQREGDRRQRREDHGLRARDRRA